MLLWLPIVGGDPAPAGRWPQLVALEGQDGDLCTGTLVAPDWVLTAGHCQNMQTAHVGALDYTANGETLAVVEQIVHPEPRATFDVSLLRLERAATGVTPARLLTGCMAAFIQEDADLTVTGYGWLDREATQQNSILHEVVVPIVDPTCT
ncbi:MAG: trypsin-like serine protease, partial [Myxococcales bacterium]|nr:trypsin-like serine protease [Myxococcales bacterium]